MEDFIILAQFDNPASAEYLRLKQELIENKISFQLQGEDGSMNDVLFYDIKVFIKKDDYAEAKAIVLKIKENKTIASFCPKCDSDKITVISKNMVKCSECSHEWVPFNE